MAPDIWSALTIFLLAPLGIALITTVAVLLLASPVGRPVADSADEPEDEGSEPRHGGQADPTDEE